MTSMSGGERKVYTLALNPAIDRTFWIDRLDFDESNRVKRECRYPGGKGIDVSRVLTNLGLPNVALGFYGGYTGQELEARLACEGVMTDLINVEGETRTNIIVHEDQTGRHLLLTASGPEVTSKEMDALFDRLGGLEDASVFAIGGSMPPGAGDDTYRRIISMLRKKGVTTFLDADGEALRLGIEAGPDYIKPNRYELGELVGRELDGIDDVVEAAGSLRSSGVGTVLASMDADGMVLVGEGQALWAQTPKVEVVNTIGVGDSAVAGFIYGLVTGLGPSESLRYGTAAGTATVLKPGTARAGKDDVLAILPRITVKDLTREGYVRAR